jgi:predicted phosphodiesterase
VPKVPDLSQPLRRVGLLGDIHAEDGAVEVALRHLEGACVDAVLAVGDIMDGPGDASRCCRLLLEAGAVTVRGNHDRWMLTNTMRDLPDATHPLEVDATAFNFIAGLPVTRPLATVAGQALLCHGLLDDDMGRVLPGDDGYDHKVNPRLRAILQGGTYAFLLNGHTHERLLRTVDGLTVVNAGTLTASRGQQPGFLVLDFVERAAQWVELTPGLELVPQPLCRF